MRPIYKVVCEGVFNLADKFFEMERSDALKVGGGAEAGDGTAGVRVAYAYGRVMHQAHCYALHCMALCICMRCYDAHALLCLHV